MTFGGENLDIIIAYNETLWNGMAANNSRGDSQTYTSNSLSVGQTWTMPQSLKTETLNKTDPGNWTGCKNSTVNFYVTNTLNKVPALQSFEARQLAAANQSLLVVAVLETGASSAVKIVSAMFCAAIMACALIF